jgi:hypothetical protein
MDPEEQGSGAARLPEVQVGLLECSAAQIEGQRQETSAGIVIRVAALCQLRWRASSVFKSSRISFSTSITRSWSVFLSSEQWRSQSGIGPPLLHIGSAQPLHHWQLLFATVPQPHGTIAI